LLRAMQERRLIETERGRIAVGWLIVEDIAMVAALVLLPAIAGIVAPAEESGANVAAMMGLDISTELGVTFGKVQAYMMLKLVLLPAIDGIVAPEEEAGANVAAMSGLDIATALGITFGKVAAFMVLMLVIGRRVIPWLLHYVVHTGSRELFRLAVLAIALGVA